MLHDNSDYNIIENNISIGNYDNFVMYNSNYNMIANNKGYNPRGSQVRFNHSSVQDYVMNNQFYGGNRGIYLYGYDNGADISGNTFYNVNYQLVTNHATRVLFTNNQSNALGYKLKKGDRVVFGVNTINRQRHPAIDLKPLQTIENGQKQHIPLIRLAATARTE
jgi:nitrous oxidase accessory protein NosD